MRKEKWSYLILVAEVLVIAYLHSAKEPGYKEPIPAEIVKKTETSPKKPTRTLIHATAYQLP